jgi:transcription elongation factor Elf1
MDWAGIQAMNAKTFTCGHCGKIVASDRGYRRQSTDAKGVYLCPFCDKPTYISDNEQVPGVAPGNEVLALPKEVEALYREARNCVAVASYTSAVLTCRKILMHIAVEQKADVGKSFRHYVDYLAQQGFIPPNGRGWVTTSV